MADEKIKLDEIDRSILEILQNRGRITNAQLAVEVGISPPAMLERVKRLEKSGVIKNYAALINYKSVGQDVIAWVSVSLAIHQLQSIDAFQEAVDTLEEVLECYHITGEDDFLLKIVVKNIAEYEDFILHKLTLIPGVTKIRTSFVLSTVKFDTRIPFQITEK